MKTKNLKGLFSKLGGYGDDALRIASKHGDDAVNAISHADDEWLTNVLVDNRTINGFNSTIPTAADRPIHKFAVAQTDLYRNPTLNGVKNLYWDSDYDTFRKNLVADYAAFDPSNLHDPYANIENLMFEDGLSGLLNNTEAQNWANSVLSSDNISNADFLTAERLSRRNQNYINDVFKRFGSDAVESYSLPSDVNMTSATQLQDMLNTLLNRNPRRKWWFD